MQRSGVHHCDLKPSNFIKMDYRGQKVIRVIDLELCTTADDVLVESNGTEGFKPPVEQCRYWCFAADVYGAMKTMVWLVCVRFLAWFVLALALPLPQRPLQRECAGKRATWRGRGCLWRKSNVCAR